jgi:hypothetical protein
MRFFPFLLLCLATPDATLRYWVEPCAGAKSGCLPGDPELAGWALEAWQAASAGELTLERTAELSKAQIRVRWATGRDGIFGETRPIVVHGRRGAEVYVLPSVVPPGETDRLLRDAIVYLTVLHETGHALGLPHTAAFADIMYSFQYGGDIPEYFTRYRRLLSSRADIRAHSGISAADRKRLLETWSAAR